jgi:glycosyltransferase involved in cell wall biosynthesis
MTFQGSDSRITGFHVTHFEFSHCKVQEYGAKEELVDKRKEQNIKTYSKYVNHFFALNPDLLHTLPKNSSFLPYSNINLKEWSFSRPRSESNLLKILHAPSNLDVKGTRFILEAIEHLKSEGFLFDFRLVHDVNHEEMKNIMLDSDILIDQLLAGWYGGVAVEAMAIGLPVICYIRDEDKKYLPTDLIADLPIIEATPKTIYDVIKRVLGMPREELKNKQLRCREFVEKWHDPKKVARLTKEFYIGTNN